MPAYKADLVDRLARRYQYQDIENNNRLDLVIVVHQLLTGFDAPFVNALYIDKVMDLANLIQAFSRTNRVVDSRKPYGIIEYYRRPLLMKQNINQAFELYANKQARGSIMEAPDQSKCIVRITEAYHISAIYLSVMTITSPILAKFLPIMSNKKQFVCAMNHLEENMIRIRQHGFELSNPDDMQLLPFDNDDYERLQARYLDLQNGGGGISEPTESLMIDITLFDGERILIDNDYISFLLNKINQSAKQNQSDGIQAIQAKLNELSSKYKQSDQELLGQIIQAAL